MFSGTWQKIKHRLAGNLTENKAKKKMHWLRTEKIRSNLATGLAKSTDWHNDVSSGFPTTTSVFFCVASIFKFPSMAAKTVSSPFMCTFYVFNKFSRKKMLFKKIFFSSRSGEFNFDCTDLSYMLSLNQL